MKPETKQPPRWADRFLQWFCKPGLLEMIQGDLYEQFEEMAAGYPRRASWRYGWEVLRLFRPPIIRHPLLLSSTTTLDMWKNYVKVAWRSLRKQATYSLINLGGLSLGIVCFLLLFAYVRHESSYDDFHEKGDNTYHVYWKGFFDGAEENISVTPTAVLPTLTNTFPEVEAGVRLYNPGHYFPQLVKAGEVVYEETSVFYVDSTFFDVFSFSLLSGNPDKVLANPRSVVLSEDAAQRYFGTYDVVGKEMELRGEMFTVTGLVANAPANSSFNYTMLASFSSLPQSKTEIWGTANYFTYVVLRPEADKDQMQAKLENLMMEAFGSSRDDDKITYQMLPLEKIHLEAPFIHSLKAQGSLVTLQILAAIGVLVLVIACINYMNLATARSVFRAREVGMRKVLGAMKTHIFRQFMSEAGLLTLLSIALGTGLMFLIFPQFQLIAGGGIRQPLTEDYIFWVYLVGIAIGVTLLAGSYPSLVLSGFRPIQVLKGAFSRSSSGQVLRKGLVVFQFVVSAVLVFGTAVITQQLDFLRNTPLGYNKDQVVNIPITWQLNQKLSSFKESLQAVPGVVAIGTATNPPYSIQGGYSIWVEGMPTGEYMNITASAIDEGFISTLGIEMVSGRAPTIEEMDRARNASEELEYLPSAIVLNRSAVAKMSETPESILGLEANINGRKGPVVGVIEDFHFRSLHQEVMPLALFVQPSQLYHMVVKLDGNGLPNAISGLQEVWEGIIPERPFSYSFLDESYAAMYEEEARLGKIIRIFAVMAIFIACLGLFGLASFAVVQRSKEVAIRKVLGASLPQLVGLLGKQFLFLMGISLFIALPLGYYLAGEWLNNFAYSISLGVGLSIISGGLVVGLGMFTVSLESLKAGLSNPITKLRSE